MKALKSILMLIAVGLIFTAWSTPVEKVLQNGLEGYAGCADALVFSKAGYETITYGTHDSLKIYWSSS